MKKNVLTSASLLLAVAIISVASAANIVADKLAQNPAVQEKVQQVAQNREDAEKIKARQEKIQQIDEQIKKNIRMGRPVDQLEQERQDVLRGLDDTDIANKEKLKKIDAQIERLLKENKPVDELQKKRQEIIDTMPNKLDYLSDDLQKVNEQISKALQRGENIEKLETMRNQIEEQLQKLSQ